jgi:hypothetical protein
MLNLPAFQGSNSSSACVHTLTQRGIEYTHKIKAKQSKSRNVPLFPSAVEATPAAWLPDSQRTHVGTSSYQA